MPETFESLVYENASGIRTVLSDSMISSYWEMRGRTGFSAPEIEIITQKYASGVTKVLKRITQPREVSIQMVVTGKNRAKRDTLFFEMIDQIMDISGGDVGKLYITRGDGVTVYLNCSYSSGLSVQEEYQKFHKFTLSIYAADPYFFRDLADVLVDLPPESKLTLRDWVVLGEGHVLGETSGIGRGTIRNATGSRMDPIIRAKKISGNFSITNLTTGNELVLKNINSLTSDTLVIDTRETSKSIFLEHADGTKTAAGQYLDWGNIDLDFPIIPGDNDIRYEAGAGSYTEGVVFQMSERYISA